MDTPQQRGPTADELEAMRRAQDCIQECHVEQLIMESKFLRVDSLQELLKVCHTVLIVFERWEVESLIIL